MNKVAIFTDSTADLSKDLYIKYDINVIPLLVEIDGKTILDDGKVTSEMIFSSVAKTGVLPRTSAVPPAVISEAFKPFIDKGYDIYYIGIGSTLSATYQSANLAAKDFPEGRVFIGDSMNLSCASSLLTLKACKLRDEGKSAEEIFDKIQEYVPLISSQFVVEKLDYLHKGGRCGGTTLWVGRLLKIHPMIKIINGKLEIYRIPKGKMVKALDELINEFESNFPNIDMDHFFLINGDSTKEMLDYLMKALTKHIDPNIISIVSTGAVISSHCGPNTVGFMYLTTPTDKKEKCKSKKRN